jgi:hypothetical protein
MIGSLSSYGYIPQPAQLMQPFNPLLPTPLLPQQLASQPQSPQIDLSAPQLDPTAGLICALFEVCKALASMLPRGAAGASTTAAQPTTASATLPGSAVGGANPQAMNASADPRLSRDLSALASDPEGARLLAAAQANGYTIEVGDPGPAAGSGVRPGQRINGVTLPDQKKIIISPNAPEFTKTLIHELVHAATPGDGNSQTEEGIADVIGYRIANRITGQAIPGDANSIFSRKIANYPGLTGVNAIRNSLASLGLSAGI